MELDQVFYHAGHSLFENAMTQAPPPEQPEAHQRTYPARPLRTTFGDQLFMNENGPLWIWRITLYALFAYFLYQGMGPVITALLRPQMGYLWLGLSFQVWLVAVAMLPAFVFGRLEGRPFKEFGLPGEGALGRTLWQGILWGLVAITMLLIAMRGVGVFDFGSAVLNGTRALKFAGFWAAFFICVSFFEEFLFRGYSLFTLSEGIGFWPSSLLLSALFGLVHFRNKGENLAGALAAALIGLFFCFTLRRTGNLWFAVGFHASWDWGESYLYGVPDSGSTSPGHLFGSSFHGPSWLTGGSVGPEGSALVFILIALLFAAFHHFYPAGRDSA
jgi:uncharacterized protein